MYFTPTLSNGESYFLSILSRALMELEIGKKIKTIRKEKRTTLQTLSKQTGLSAGYLSKIEKSEKAPPVFTLARIAHALGVAISSFLGEDIPRTSFCLSLKEDRKQIDVPDFGYTYETIATKFQNKMMDPFIIVIPTDRKSIKIPKHEGEELLFVLEGKLKFSFDNYVCILEKGDCVYFDSGETHHVVESLGTIDAKCLAVFCDLKKK